MLKPHVTKGPKPPTSLSVGSSKMQPSGEFKPSSVKQEHPGPCVPCPSPSRLPRLELHKMAATSSWRSYRGSCAGETRLRVLGVCHRPYVKYLCSQGPLACISTEGRVPPPTGWLSTGTSGRPGLQPGSISRHPTPRSPSQSTISNTVFGSSTTPEVSDLSQPSNQAGGPWASLLPCLILTSAHSHMPQKYTGLVGQNHSTESFPEASQNGHLPTLVPPPIKTWGEERPAEATAHLHPRLPWVGKGR